MDDGANPADQVVGGGVVAESSAGVRRRDLVLLRQSLGDDAAHLRFGAGHKYLHSVSWCLGLVPAAGNIYTALPDGNERRVPARALC